MKINKSIASAKYALCPSRKYKGLVYKLRNGSRGVQLHNAFQENYMRSPVKPKGQKLLEARAFLPRPLATTLFNL